MIVDNTNDVERLEKIRWYWMDSERPQISHEPDIVFLLRLLDERDEKERGASPANVCTWRLDNNDWDGNVWKTSCGQDFILFDSTPAENGMNFCHYCGNSVFVVEVCIECGKYAADLPSKLCPGCDAYREHQR
jgi:hypothetical protein